MYKTDFIVRYHDIENELVRRLEVRLAAEAAAEITAAIESVFRNAGEHSNENIVINVEVGGSGDSDDDNRGRRIEVVNSSRSRLQNTNVNTNDNANENVVASGDSVANTIVGSEEVEDQETDAVNEEDEDENEEDYKYTRKDVTYICEKLYRDELLSVFGAESIDDPKMDEGIKAIFEALIKNEEFQSFLTEMNGLLSDPSKAKTETELANLKRNTDYLLFITLFSQQSFYLTHKCLCQMLTLGHVEPDMMDQLKQRTLKIFQISDKKPEKENEK
jgi:hypothetical protein